MNQTTRTLTPSDNAILKFHSFIKKLSFFEEINKLHKPRVNPSNKIIQSNLQAKEAKLSSQMMRVNYTGEVCAQALYIGQALAAKCKNKRDFLLHAASEEKDHLVWCKERLQELNSHTSYLNPIWFLGSIGIGAFAGFCGDKWSMGFLAETEYQVTAHLQKHLKNISKNDKKSIAIIEQMCKDELEHATNAIDKGGVELPGFIKNLMKKTAMIMTFSATYI